MLRITAVIIIAVAAALAPTLAHAQVPATKAAEDTFNKGRELMKDKKYAEACAAFKQSQQLDPQYGTQYNLAGCYALSGKLASAWNLYRELSRSDNNPDRRQASSDQATALAARVPKIAIVFDIRPDGAKLLMNDVDALAFVGIETPVDLGTYTFTASAPGYQTWNKTVEVKAENVTVKVVVDLGKLGDPRHVTPPDPKPTEPGVTPIDAGGGGSNKQLYGKIATIGGGAILATGFVFGGLASSKWSSAKTTAGTGDVAGANKLTHTARVYGDVSTGLVIGGAVIAAAGAYLWFFTHDDESTHRGVAIAPMASPDAGGLVVSGRF